MKLSIFLILFFSINSWAVKESWLINCSEDSDYAESFVSIYKDFDEVVEQGIVIHNTSDARLACPMMIFNGVDRGYPITCAGVWNTDFVPVKEGEKPLTHVDTVVVVKISKDTDTQLWYAEFVSNKIYGEKKVKVPCTITYNEQRD